MKHTKKLTSRFILHALDCHKDVLRKCSVRRIGLFGSFARGCQKKNSDIDFLVEFDKPGFDNFLFLSNYLERLYKRKVDLVTPAGLSPFVKPYVEEEICWHQA